MDVSWLVVSGHSFIIYYFYPYLGRWSNLIYLTIFHRGWNHQLGLSHKFKSPSHPLQTPWAHSPAPTFQKCRNLQSPWAHSHPMPTFQKCRILHPMGLHCHRKNLTKLKGQVGFAWRYTRKSTKLMRSGPWDSSGADEDSAIGDALKSGSEAPCCKDPGPSQGFDFSPLPENRDKVKKCIISRYKVHGAD